MNKILVTKLAALLCLLSMVSCVDRYLDDNARVEYYTRNFIMEFGLIDPEQDWNMATRAEIPINLGDRQAREVKVYTRTGDQYYLVARLQGVSGMLHVPVDVPKQTREVLVRVDGTEFTGTIGDVVNCTGLGSRNIYGNDNNGSNPYEQGQVGEYMARVTYATTGNLYNQTGTGLADNNGNISGVSDLINYGKAYTSYTSPAQWKLDGLEDLTYETDPTKPISRYQYFNTQQILPIVSNGIDETEIEYYSLNTRKWGTYRSHRGILPENGNKNQYRADQPVPTAENGLEFDASLRVGHTGKLTIFPYFYNATYIHTFGVYLMDDNNDPIKVNGEMVKFPVFNDKQAGDIQLALVLAGIKDIVILDDHDNETDVITIEVGETYDLLSHLRAVDQNDNYITDYQTYPNNYSSKFGFHYFGDWNDAASQNEYYIDVNRDGQIKGLKAGTAKTLEIAAEGYRRDQNNNPITINVVGVRPKAGDVFHLTTNIPAGEIKVQPGETKTYQITKLTLDRDGVIGTEDVWEAYKDYVKATPNNWYSDYFDFTLNGRTITVTGKQANAAKEEDDQTQMWPKIYLDRNNNGWQEGDTDNDVLLERHVRVPATITTTYNHTYTIDSTTWPSDLTPGWDYYFAGGTGAQTISVLSSPVALNWQDSQLNIIDATLTSGGTVTYYVTSTSSSPQLQIKVADSWIGEQSITYTDNATGDQNKFTYSYTVKDADAGTNKLIFAQGQNCTVTDVTVTTPAGSGNGGMNAATTALRNYYQSYNVGTQTCETSSCGHHNAQGKVDFTGATMSLNMNDSYYTSESDNKLHYTVTWTKTETETVEVEDSPSGSAPKRYAPLKKSKKVTYPTAAKSAPKARRAASRATHAETDPMPTRLNYANTSGWTEPNKIWDRNRPLGDEAASFITDDELLARSRGYTIEIKNPDGTLYSGKVGFYIDVYRNPGLDDTSHSWEDWPVGWNNEWYNSSQLDNNYGQATGNFDYKYTLYSQSQLNIVSDDDGNEYEMSYACYFPHPVSRRDFYSFEDWKVVKPAKGDIRKSDGKALEGVEYSSSDYSSDRDFNDLIYVIQRYEGSSFEPSTPTPKYNENGYSWIWALEDLGSTYDFDFNDAVIKISSITETDWEELDGNKVEGSEKYINKITLEPLAAGGTLPLYVHFKYGDVDYVLSPGEAYDLTENGTGTKPAKIDGGVLDGTATEYHGWFGNNGYGSTVMINTGDRPRGVKARKCEITVDNSFTIASCNTAGAMIDAVSNGYFYITVNGVIGGGSPDSDTGYGSLDLSETNQKLDGQYTVPLPKKGQATQSFIIFTGDIKNGGTWRWPSECTPIIEAYPHFQDWINNASTYKNNWTTDGVVESKLYHED